VPAGPGGDLIQATAIWVAADPATGRPCPLGEDFLRIYRPATGGRRVDGTERLATGRLIP
jgi:acyl-ACP thioesterase